MNAPNAVEIGITEMRSFEESWQEGFNATLVEVVTMAVNGKFCKWELWQYAM